MLFLKVMLPNTGCITLNPVKKERYQWSHFHICRNSLWNKNGVVLRGKTDQRFKILADVCI